MEAWVAPAVIAAVIASAITAVGWIVTHFRETRAAKSRRLERVRDVQTALRAEIRSFYFRFAGLDFDAYAQSIVDNILAGDGNGGAYTPFIPKEPKNLIFSAIVGEIHILPGPVIDPIAVYYRQMDTISSFADDLRSDGFAGMEPARKAEMYKDYIAMLKLAHQLAFEALEALDRRAPPPRRLSSPDAGRSDHRSA